MCPQSESGRAGSGRLGDTRAGDRRAGESRAPKHGVAALAIPPIPALLGLFALAYTATRVSCALAQSAAIRRTWASERARPAARNDFVLLALGDSAMQGTGATSAAHSIAGILARRIAERTGRRVIVRNHAVGGATIAAILAAQLPNADCERADLIIVSSANDLEQRVDPRRYKADVERLAALLPADRTIWSDVPFEPGRARYQAILQHETDGAGIGRADFASAFRRVRSPFIFSWLPPHLNDRGYAIWAGAFASAAREIVGGTHNHSRSDRPRADARGTSE